jgi:DNA-binding transcriptional LysR family regulator
VELRQLTTFQAVIAHGSFVRAAEELGYAQSTVTLHIQQLEAEVGTPLFMRAGRTVTLTEVGRTLREQSASILQQMERLEETMAGVATGVAGRLRIGAVEPAASTALLPLIFRFTEERPRVQISLEIGGTLGISDRVARGDLDLGLCSPPPAHSSLTFEPLFRESLAVLLPARHRLTARDPLRSARRAAAAHGANVRLSCSDRGGTRGTRHEPVFRHRNRLRRGIEAGGAARSRVGDPAGECARAAANGDGAPPIYGSDDQPHYRHCAPCRCAGQRPNARRLRGFTPPTAVGAVARCQMPVTKCRSRCQ